jgi:hypothetical protein
MWSVTQAWVCERVNEARAGKPAPKGLPAAKAAFAG